MEMNLLTGGIMKMTFHSIFIMTMITCCVDYDKCPRYVQITAFIAPSQIEYHIGDTIRIISKFHRNVLAFNSGEKEIGLVDMANMEWKPATLIFRTDTLGQAGITTIHKYFIFLEDEIYDYQMNIISNDFSLLQGKYNYHNDTFDLQIKLIPLKTGTYFLRQESTTGQSEIQNFPDKCPGENVDVWVTMNNYQTINDNNIDLLTESPDTHFNTWILTNPKTNFYNFGGYCFRVIP